LCFLIHLSRISHLKTTSQICHLLSTQ